MAYQPTAHRPAGATRRRARKRRRGTPGKIGIYGALTAFAVVSLLPFGYILLASLKDGQALFQYPPQWIPDPITFDNFSRLFTDQNFLRWTFNSVFVAGAVTVLKVLFDSMAGYALAKLEFNGKGPLIGLMLATVMVPIGVLIIPLFFIVRSFGMLDTYWALILPPLANPIGIFMMRTYIMSIPGDMESAARLDNCSEWGIYWRIILPLVKPGLVVVAIYTFFMQYTNFIWPLVATSSESMFTLTTGLASLNTESARDWGLISAGAALAMVPITAVFLLFQRQFVAASLTGALKD